MSRKILFCICAVLCAVLFLSVFGVFFYGMSATTAYAGGTAVVLDAGHGGIDGGVPGKNTKIPESDINLSIVRYMEKRLLPSDIQPILTRCTEAGLYGLPTKGFKRRDMEKRKEIILASNPSAVISVHQNSCTDSGIQRGGQVFYRPGSEESKALAEHIQCKLNEVNPFGSERSVKAGDYYILNCSSVPSVIVECGFLSDSEEEKYLVTDEYQKILADAICDGMEEYLASAVAK